MRVCGRPTPPDSPKSSVKSCDKIDKPGPDTFFAPRNRLKIRNCPARKGLSVSDLPIFSLLLTLRVICRSSLRAMKTMDSRTKPTPSRFKLIDILLGESKRCAKDHLVPSDLDFTHAARIERHSARLQTAAGEPIRHMDRQVSQIISIP